MKKLVFLTGTRADYGKIKALMQAVEKSELFKLQVFVTGMHMLSKYGSTYKEIMKDEFSDIYQFVNTRDNQRMDITLSNTIMGFSNYVEEFKPDLIVVHGDRVEALAGAIVGAFNNIRVAHIEGGEVSGTIDESIRHAITKFAHFHLVANEKAAQRIVQLGEKHTTIFEVGSPDIDVMQSNNLPTIEEVKLRYEINFPQYHIVMFHPVTTEIDTIELQINELVIAIKNYRDNFVIIYPNNDEGSSKILNAYKQLEGHSHIKIFPSIRFEYFLTLLKNAKSIIGNSSAGIREAGVYATPTIDIGNRQNGRYLLNELPHILHVEADSKKIVAAINSVGKLQLQPQSLFGSGESVKKFMAILNDDRLWKTTIQKQFISIQG
ncbi:UDP-N-acetylglucosamine 2-epimerase [Lysinibacillus sp. A4]|uniref:UDP-N-acetylglucosamine 2-epimerase n=1 Tax=Lysinibacillus sp. A4 TaxID=2976269 RepID=UPI002175D1ED|nr:UDP-N-acetylglucosamine 2-epimerase [Lysinibacillus sp. A4]MCS5503269.1 UDP-N-acetylglucosamine 2-epimerase [Lysinibacillus sp. A4]